MGFELFRGASRWRTKRAVPSRTAILRIMQTFRDHINSTSSINSRSRLPLRTKYKRRCGSLKLDALRLYDADAEQYQTADPLKHVHILTQFRRSARSANRRRIQLYGTTLPVIKVATDSSTVHCCVSKGVNEPSAAVSVDLHSVHCSSAPLRFGAQAPHKIHYAPQGSSVSTMTFIAA